MSHDHAAPAGHGHADHHAGHDHAAHAAAPASRHEHRHAPVPAFASLSVPFYRSLLAMSAAQRLLLVLPLLALLWAGVAWALYA